MAVDGSAVAAWGIAAVATAGVIARPFRLPEAIWAVTGAVLLVAFGLLPWADAWSGVRKGLDVYCFLAGMMLIAEVARQEGVFDWLAALAVALARGSPQRLFALIYAVGTVVTVLLSNDATAVVLTPAVYAATRAAGAAPLPYLLVCAFIANAASFVLPISNPANLVVFAGHMPHLLAWLGQFGLPCHRDCRDLSGVTADAAPGAGGGDDRGNVAAAATRPWRAPHAGRHRRGCRRAVVLFGVRCATRVADLCQRRGDDRDRAGIEPPVAVASAQRRVVGCAAAGRGPVRSGGSARSHRSHCHAEPAA